MSLLLLTCLFGYAALRSTMWVRGRWRFRRLRAGLPQVSPPALVPAHVGGALRELLACSYSRRVGLVESARSIATVLIVDPDVPFGVVRDLRYRFALAQAWSEARTWIRAWEALDEAERRRVVAFGYDAEVFRERGAALLQVVRVSVRAPALEPFAVSEVVVVQGVVEALVRELEGFERAITRSRCEAPYRV